MDYVRFFRRIGASSLDLTSKLSYRDALTVVGVNSMGQKTLKIDQALEDLVIKELEDANLSGTLITEEKGEVALGGGGGRVFVLDPLDGSANYTRRVPFYGLALCAANGRKYRSITDSYIINFASKDEYWASDRRGAFRNSARIKSSRETDLENCILEYDPNENPSIYRKIRPLLGKVKDVRRFGANALGLCFIASGAHHIFIDLGARLSVVHAAGLHIVEEAGGVVTYDTTGKKFDVELKSESMLSFICAGNRTLHRKVLTALK